MTSKREDREALITEAAEAIVEAMGGIVPDELESMHADAAKAALAVFEQAHTPTDDERELLAEADALVASWDLKGSWTSESPVGLVMRLAAALRRPVQGEPSDARFRGIVGEVVAEAERSIAKHGEQGDLPMGTGPGTYPLATDGPAMFDTLPAEDLAEIATADTKYHSRNEGGNDTCTWWHILREEVFEAAAESDPAALAEELVQVAAVAVKMIDALRAAAAVQNTVTIPEHLSKRDELGPAIRKVLVDDARAENDKRRGEDARRLRAAVTEQGGENRG